MKFAIQTTLASEESLQKLKDGTDGLPRIFVEVIPFSTEITSDEDLSSGEFIPYGSTLMTTLALDLGWRGLYFDLRTANYRAFLENRIDMLNNQIMPISDAIEYLKRQDPESNWFMRPSMDLKQFTGLVINAKEGHEWLVDALECDSSGSYALEEHTDIVVSIPKNIQAEWRWFVVGGKVISGSLYRAREQLRSERVTDSKQIHEAQELADYWLPHENCVMDLGLVNDELKVIEFNCINSSGFYDHDVKAIFNALWEYENR